ncbi:hypothetical protein RI030_01020 [Aphanizomenon flos-aquae NRERC-008]|jgi:hypothetical protein|uniref:Uncharacterized protein n=1 Tax=Aphanizomenon flos-aquae FACHB-1249 TaxID=2692889 RepID=A0ABR8ISC0_APHFL|nr:MULTISPECIES: hypothetical protein [Aphanizomenon]MBD2392606.1 hypothetical protein [Aphanizomenon flos-aquae FACHB-1171]MBD2558966.1 hypothetical protein [Aphanizomenon flos-aquae FACHB-1290]MBD2631670.1 hypothetical protein [Aphanizomenon sp. FACHB-1399]MBD2642604.1 hypothetical protein [Aphanizomenon sp. FACHB-1401]MBD2659296.1 hypothetical protein [Aphanizomenon flos-aquae FACHB-1265]
MSGQKTFNITAGISTATQPGLFDGIASALQAYQERQRQEREAAIKKEQDIQQKIAQFRSGANRKKIVVEEPQQIKTISSNAKIDIEVNKDLSQDAQRQVQNLKMQLPKIKSEYQILIDRELLDAASVKQAMQKAEMALQNNHFTDAQIHLQTLDDARIKVIQQLKIEWTKQLEFLQSRLNNLQSSLPDHITQQLQIKINDLCNSWQSISDENIEILHQEISRYESQAEQVYTAAKNLVASWQEVGYVAKITGINDGDVVINIETHEGVNTQMRIQFDGQQIDLAGPHDEEGDSSCSSRTFDVIELFQQQGYQVEWTAWNGEPVDKEWRNVDMGIISVKTTMESDFNKIPERRSESQGY